MPSWADRPGNHASEAARPPDLSHVGGIGLQSLDQKQETNQVIENEVEES